MKKILLTGIFILSTFMLSAQLTLGTTGLLNSPSADMQPDKMVMLGGNFLHDRITPNGFPYNTYNYFLNITFLPFLRGRLHVSPCSRLPISLCREKKGRFVNQDRAFSVRLRR